MGTAGYAAPEQYGFSQTDARADLYALGVLLNEMLVRQHPARQLAEGSWLPIISKCIEVNVDRRYATAEELRSAVERVRTERTDRKKPASAFALGALIVVGCALLAGMIYNPDQQREIQVENSEVSQFAPSLTEYPEVIQSAQGSAEYLEEEQSVPDPDWVSEHGTKFYYDLDGNGEKEVYVFGVALDSKLLEPYIADEYIGIPEYARPSRRPFPCVWRYGEDGSLAVAQEFVPLLEQAEVTMHCVTDPEAPQPDIFPWDSIWPGGIRILFPAGYCGLWRYEATAVIDGEILTATATTTTYRIDEVQ